MDPLRWQERPTSLRDPVLVAAFRGWNDAAAAASSTLSFVAGRLDARPIAVIDPDDFYDFQATRPQIDLSTPGEAHLIRWPEVELSAVSAPGLARDLVLVAGAEPSMRWRAFCGLLLDAARDMGVKLVVTLGSLLADVPHTRPVRLTGMASDPELIAGLGMRQPSYRGPTGIVGVLHEAAMERGFSAVSLWAPASHYAAGVTNAKATLALVRGLEAVTGLTIDADDLDAAAHAYVDQVSRAVEADPRLRTLVEQLEQAADQEASDDPGPLPSGEELAAEFERYLRRREDGPA
jgi:proteasome assembly chaperone (PAC2) family protein